MQRILQHANLQLIRREQVIKGGLSPDTQVHFLTFANTSYMKPDRIVEEAKGFAFSTITAMNEHDISDFIEKHRSFIETNRAGYGLWIWKPAVILQRLQQIPQGDILVYCDAGTHLNRHGLPRYYEYLTFLSTKSMVVFSCNDLYKAQYYVKRDVVSAYYPDFANQLTNYSYAGLMLVKHTPEAVRLLKDWLALCETYHYIDFSESVAKELPIFRGNDCDNGLFNLCLAKHSISHVIYPDEVMLYAVNGSHYDGPTTEQDWNRLRSSPFQVRRIRPKKQMADIFMK